MSVNIFEDDDEYPGLLTWIKHKYWNIIPYEWRPGQILYRLKCFFFKRYTTIKPRTLNFHTWCDRSHLLPHLMFEVLSQFIEGECSPGHIDWEASDHRIDVNGKSVNVRDEMQFLYDWWHKTYLKDYPAQENAFWESVESVRPKCLFQKRDDGHYIYEPTFNNDDDKNQCHELLRQIRILEKNAEADLQEMLHRLVNIIPYMWT